MFIQFLGGNQTPTGKTIPFQIIPDLPTFVGRQELLDKLRGLLLADYHEGAYLLTGEVGIGKTVLAVRLAYQLRSHFEDGVLWARLDTMPIMSILQLWGEALGGDVAKYGDMDSRSTAVRQLLATKQALIVLDNVQNDEQLLPLLPASGVCAVLITSRRRNLTTLPQSHRFHLQAFTTYEAMALWERVLGDEQVHPEQKVLTEIATLVGYHPLALDLAACRLAYEIGWETADLHQRLNDQQQRLSLLTHGERTLSAALEASYGLLPLQLQHFYMMLGSIDSLDFSVEEAAMITGVALAQANDYLRELFALCLVRRGQRVDRYRLIPVLRDFARNQSNNAEAVRAF